MLYPLKFLPLFKDKVWGGSKIKSFGFDYDPLPNCGEMWVLSAVKDNESIVENGFLADNTLDEILEIYMGELIGERNFERFGTDFPLLIKLIDAADDLSIQVHPDDALARQRGMSSGKTEMWYILEAEEGARLIDGFERNLSPDEYQRLLADGRLEEALHVEHPQRGDLFFIPGGRVHAIGKGLLLAEIQQSSDCTYRIYDYNRPGSDGKLRELHTEQALDAISFEAVADGCTHYNYKPGTTTPILDTPYFTTSIIDLVDPIRKNLSSLDSFVVYLCIDGIAAVKSMDTITPLHAGECILIPAVAEGVELFAEGKAKLLEVYVDPDKAPADECTHQYDNDWFAVFDGQEDFDDDDDCCHCHDHGDDCHCHDHDCHCHDHGDDHHCHKH